MSAIFCAILGDHKPHLMSELLGIWCDGKMVSDPPCSLKQMYEELQHSMKTYNERPIPVKEVPKAGEVWLCNNGEGELTIVAFDEASGEIWVRFHNTGASKVYGRDRWRRWQKKPEFELPHCPGEILFVYQINTATGLLGSDPIATIPKGSKRWETRVRPYLRQPSRYRVTTLRQTTRHGASHRYTWYTMADFEDDECYDEDDDD